jgi:hypothetical protein
MWNSLTNLFHKLVHDTAFNVGDGAAGGITVATIINILPTISAVLSIIWVAIRIYVSIRDDILERKKDGNLK